MHVDKEVSQRFLDIIALGYLEDRTEYDREDLQSAYPELSESQVEQLFVLIQKEGENDESFVADTFCRYIAGVQAMPADDIKQALKFDHDEVFCDHF